jgi:hypothetical protein
MVLAQPRHRLATVRSCSGRIARLPIIAGMKAPTLGWWITRLEFAIAVGAVIAIPILHLSQPVLIGDARPDGFYLRQAATVLAAFLVAVVGLAWMVRIYRAPGRQAPPAWRYRDR